MGGPRDWPGPSRPEVLEINATGERTINDVEPAVAIHVGKHWNVFQAAGHRDGRFKCAVEREDEEISI